MSELTKEKIYKNELEKIGGKGNNNLERIRSLEPEGTLEITSTNEVDVSKYAKAQVVDENLIATNIRLGKTILGIEGNLDSDKPDQTKNCTPTTSEQVIQADTGYELASVTVEAVTSSIDQNIVAGNIKKDVEILGVIGTYESGGVSEEDFLTLKNIFVEYFQMAIDSDNFEDLLVELPMFFEEFEIDENAAIDPSQLMLTIIEKYGLETETNHVTILNNGNNFIYIGIVDNVGTVILDSEIFGGSASISNIQSVSTIEDVLTNENVIDFFETHNVQTQFLITNTCIENSDGWFMFKPFELSDDFVLPMPPQPEEQL